jgi:hypothetical protein
MDIRKPALSLAAILAIATPALAAPAPANDGSRIAAHYSTWAGSRANADALVAGLRHGTTITLVTNPGERSMNLAGFTPTAPMGYDRVDRALSEARRSLARVGITHPTAEQIQAALVGGEVALSGGRTQVLSGTVSAGGRNSRVAAR